MKISSDNSVISITIIIMSIKHTRAWFTPTNTELKKKKFLCIIHTQFLRFVAARSNLNLEVVQVLSVHTH